MMPSIRRGQSCSTSRAKSGNSRNLERSRIEDLLTLQRKPQVPSAKSNLAEMRMQIHANAIEADLVVALTEASSKCEMRWRQARPAGDLNLVSEFEFTVLGSGKPKGRRSLFDVVHMRL